MPYPRNPNPTPEETEEYAVIDELKARIEQVTVERTSLVDRAFMCGSDAQERTERGRCFAEARDLSIIHQSMLAELANLE